MLISRVICKLPFYFHCAQHIMLITSVHSVEPATLSKKCIKDYNVFYNVQYMYTLKRIYTNKCTAIWFLLFKLSLCIIFLTYVTTLVFKI